MKRLTSRLFVPLALAMLGLAMQPVAANADICRQLEAEIASAPQGNSSPAQIRRYDRAIGAQQDQLSRAREQARRAGCSGRTFWNGAGSACGSLTATIERMERNYLKLQGDRARLAGGGDRRRIMARIEANGCRQARPAERALPRAVDGRSGSPATQDGPVRRIVVEDARRGLGGASGSLRTMCVRTCDGYFFPVSHASSPSAFDRDEQACRAMCPSAEVELYAHRARGEEPRDMVSTRTGLPYTELPEAFRYREPGYSRPAGCGCNVARNFSVIAGEPPQRDAALERPPAEPLPSARPDPAADPETLANREGGLGIEAIRRLAARPAPPSADGTLPDPEDRRVRVVGPVFLPDPEEAIDLRAPGRTDVR